ncbi:penicillin-binding transpeptidase domain-containing protein, partial [Pseudactinotalea suaedae]
MTRLRRRVVVPSLVMIAALGLGACTGNQPGTEPDRAEHERAAHRLAEVLASGETESLWTDVDLTIPLTNLADLPRRVIAIEIGEPRTLADDGPRAADVVLEWAWDLDEDGAEDWTYTTQAQVTEDQDGNWQAAYDEAALAEGLGMGGELRLTRPEPERGDIRDGGGVPIVTGRPVYRVGIDKTALPDDVEDEEIHAAAVALAEVVGLDDPVGYAERVMAAGPRAFVEIITVRQESDEVPLAELESIPGAVALPDELPLAPTASWARPLLGRAGEATAEIIEASEGAVGPGDVVGLSGLQHTYDAHLRGTPGLVVTFSHGDESEVLYEEETTDGGDLQLTLATAMQTAAEHALETQEAPAGLVAIRPSTGEVLAVANGPGTEGQNLAMLATLAPGSTFKMVTALALLRAGFAADDVVSCTQVATVSGRTIRNYPGYPSAYVGDITLTEALAQSCNSALINARDQLTPQQLADAAASLGLGQALRVDWPAYTGTVPTEMTDTELAASLIGQGDILASPLAMAVVAATIQAGEVVTPRLVLEPDDLADGGAAAGDAPAQPLSAEEAQTLAAFMRAVVEEGTATLLADVPGEPVHAKTGSAEAGEGEDYRVDSWMIAYQGDLAVAALVQGGGHGEVG